MNGLGPSVTDPVRFRIISVKVSQGCELARWLFQRAGIPFHEEFHVPLFHVLATLRAHGGGDVPVVITPTTAWRSTMGVLAGIDAFSPPGRKVYGDSEGQRLANQTFIASLLPYFQPWARRYAYYFVLRDRKLMIPVASADAPAWEVMLLRCLYPLWRWLVARGLGATARQIKPAPEDMREGLAAIEAEMASRGTPFLDGNEPGGTDIVVATLLAPIIFPPQYGGVLPPLDQVAPELRDYVYASRATPAGKLALATYALIRERDEARRGAAT